MYESYRMNRSAFSAKNGVISVPSVRAVYMYPSSAI